MKSYSYILEHNAVAAIRRADAKFDNNEITFEQYENEIQPWTDAMPVKHGHWIYEGHSGHPSEPYYSCSVCEYVCYERNANYCPNCGAKMDVVKE